MQLFGFILHCQQSWHKKQLSCIQSLHVGHDIQFFINFSIRCISKNATTFYTQILFAFLLASISVFLWCLLTPFFFFSTVFILSSLLFLCDFCKEQTQNCISIHHEGGNNLLVMISLSFQVL